MPYHGGVYCQAYLTTDYARLGCNHDASVSEVFHAFALKHKDDPNRLRWYLRLTEHPRKRQSPGGTVLAELMETLTWGDGEWGHDPLAHALAVLFQPPVMRYVRDRQSLWRIGVYRLERCGWEADRELLQAGRADRAVLETAEEFREALERTLRAIEGRDEVYLFG